MGLTGRFILRTPSKPCFSRRWREKQGLGRGGIAEASRFPGAQGLIPGGDSGGGGGLLGAASSMLGGGGGGLGGALGAVSALTGSGLSADKMGALLPLFLNFAKSQAGEGLVGRLMEGAPALKKLIG